VSKDKEVLLSVDMALEPKSILRPRVKVPKDQIKEACRPWKKAIVVKLLRKKLSMRFLRVRLPKLWQPLGEMEMIDLESDYFLIRFYVLSDLCFMFEGGP